MLVNDVVILKSLNGILLSPVYEAGVACKLFVWFKYTHKRARNMMLALIFIAVGEEKMALLLLWVKENEWRGCYGPKWRLWQGTAVCLQFLSQKP